MMSLSNYLTGCELMRGVCIGCLVEGVALLVAPPLLLLLLLAARVIAAAVRRALVFWAASPLAAAEALGDSGAYKCSGDKLPSESSLGSEEGGVKGMP